MKSISNTWSPVDGSTALSGAPVVLNGVNGISSNLLVSSPPLTLKNAVIEEVSLTLAASLTSKAVDWFTKLIGFVMYWPADEPPSVAVSSSKSTVFVIFATTLAPLVGAVVIVNVVLETVKSIWGVNFLPSFLTSIIWTSLGVALKVNPAVEPSPINVSVDDTVGLFNLFEIAKALTLFKSITGDRLAFDELNVILTTQDVPDISLVSLIPLATILGDVK